MSHKIRFYNLVSLVDFEILKENMKFILAKKLGMTTLYTEDRAENVTLLEVGKNIITSVRVKDLDGYDAVQVGLSKQGDKKGLFFLKKEFKVNSDKIADFKKDSEIRVDIFEQGDNVLVKGVNKGKGFQGGVKRHGFAGSPASHGHRHDLRAPGSIGSAFPERVFKGKKMAGRMGGKNCTVANLKVVLIDKDKGYIGVRGSVPGNNGDIVRVLSV